MQPTLNIRTKTLHLHLAPGSELPPAVLATAERIAPAVGASERFSLTIRHGAELVTDHKTGLMWPVYESEQSMDYDALEKHVTGLRLGGFADWRTPTVEERESIRDLSRYNPALFEPLKSRSNGWEWTCTPCAWSKDDAGVPAAFWQVYGLYGHLDDGHRDDRAFARPCRFVARAGQ
ncbi:MAG: hypothetical protein BGP10_15835 [Rhodanobacter sp. 68-29]|nr:DUF1566 domain-containing protein [Rhodanobacter sp.]ODV27867.1 MAG: hypothetical protein ABT19_01405 [Rhodanobacter sp. SCN 68-63]OJY61376.1 MAG: hypothetical protein BGP10_15835 [Rhodanobacter sp. 68-29]